MTRRLSVRRIQVAVCLASLACALGCREAPEHGSKSETAPSVRTAAASTTASSAAHGTNAPNLADAPRPGSEPVQVDPPKNLDRRPKLALYVNDPWAMVLGSEVPAVALYEDGSVVRAEPSPPRLVEGQLAGDRANLLSELDAALVNEPAQASLSHATDQPTVTILLETPRGWIARSVYGMSGEGAVTGPQQANAQPSASFVGALSKLRSLELRNAATYRPKQIEIMLWGYEHSPETPKPWPAGLPAPASPTPPKTGVLHHYVDGARLADVDAFLASLAPRQAVGLAGHKWSMGRRVLVPADEYLRDIKLATRRAYVDAVKSQR